MEVTMTKTPDNIPNTPQPTEQTPPLNDWQNYLAQLQSTKVPDDFLTERVQEQAQRDPFKGWQD